MGTKYYVKKIETCLKCGGKQMIDHPAWTEYWEENKGKQPMSLD